MKNKKKIFWAIYIIISTFFSAGLFLFLLSNKIQSNSLLTNYNTSKFLQDDSVVKPTGSTVSIYKPISLTIDQTKKENLKFPSQVSINDIRNYLRISPQNSTDGLASSTASGYEFQSFDSKTNKTEKVETAKLKDKTGYGLGSFSNSNLSDVSIEIINANDQNGTLSFQVFQQVKAYNLINNAVSVYNQKIGSDNTTYRAIILPPTSLQNLNLEASTWKLPSNFQLKKIEFVFSWNADQIIDDFIKNFNQTASQLSIQNVKDSFFNIQPNFYFEGKKINIPDVTVKLIPNESLGKVEIDVTLTDAFGSTNKTIKRTFIGFRVVNKFLHVQLNTINNEVLTNGLITSNLWDSNFNEKDSKFETSYLNKQIKDLLPSQFLNINPSKKFNDYSLVDLFNGKKINNLDSFKRKKTKEKTALVTTKTIAAIKSANKKNLKSKNLLSFKLTETGLTISTTPIDPTISANQINAIKFSGNDDKNQGQIAWLTYGGLRSDDDSLKNLSKFTITKIEGFPNDILGTLNLMISYQTLNNVGDAIDAQPVFLKFSGFKTNIDSGQSLFFAWNDNIPQQYATLTPNEIITNIQNNSGIQSLLDTWVNNNVALKNIALQFFTSSNYVKNKFLLPFVDKTNGGRVRFSLVRDNTKSETKAATGIKIEVGFGSYGSLANNVFSNSYTPSAIASSIDQNKRSSLVVNPDFFLTEHRFANKFPSSLTTSELLEMFILKIPLGGNEYTSNLKEAKIFSVPDDKSGQLFVSLIMPQFNGIINYEISNMFSNFKKNDLLNLDLVLKHTSQIDLSSSFLAKNPMDPNSLSADDILKNVFAKTNPRLLALLNPKDINIIERKPTSVSIELLIDWKALVNAQTSLNQTDVIKNNSVFKHSEQSENSNLRKLKFVINGFFGGNSTNGLNQTPVVPAAVLPSSQIAAIAVSVSGVLLFGTLSAGLIVYFRKSKYNNAINKNIVLPYTSKLKRKLFKKEKLHES